MSTRKQLASRLRKAAGALRKLAGGIETGETTRDDLDHAIAEITGVQREHFGPRPRAARGEGAKAKILAYLKERVGKDVYGEELRAASGIHEWARRVRELRVEDGYEIVELGQSTYRLESAKPNRERAAPVATGQRAAQSAGFSSRPDRDVLRSERRPGGHSRPDRLRRSDRRGKSAGPRATRRVRLANREPTSTIPVSSPASTA